MPESTPTMVFDTRAQTIVGVDSGIAWKSAVRKNATGLTGKKRKRKESVTRLFVCETIVSLARPQFSSGCWRARPRLPITQSAGVLRRDNASCHDRGTTRRCAPRWRLGSAALSWKRSEEATSELQARLHLACRVLLDTNKFTR